MRSLGARDDRTALRSLKLFLRQPLAWRSTAFQGCFPHMACDPRSCGYLKSPTATAIQRECLTSRGPAVAPRTRVPSLRAIRPADRGPAVRAAVAGGKGPRRDGSCLLTRLFRFAAPHGVRFTALCPPGKLKRDCHTAVPSRIPRCTHGPADRVQRATSMIHADISVWGDRSARGSGACSGRRWTVG